MRRKSSILLGVLACSVLGFFVTQRLVLMANKPVWPEDSDLALLAQVEPLNPDSIVPIEYQRNEQELSRLAGKRTWDFDTFRKVRAYLLDPPPMLSEEEGYTPDDVGRFFNHLTAFAILEVRYKEDPALPDAIRSEIEADFIRRLKSEHSMDRLGSATALIDFGLWKRLDIHPQIAHMMRNDPNDGNRLVLSVKARRGDWNPKGTRE
ncbi:MAG: hypothetical protein EA380_08355 [Phycisphaeraceae bacterium]|nr:MAG: hypothetical protein EA380_08355 [Phycisphaeraceae bacterium]